MTEKEGGIVKKGHEEGVKFAVSVVQEYELPGGLLPLVDVIKVGFVKGRGYMWILQQKKVKHQTKSTEMSEFVSYEYDTEITGYVERKRIWEIKSVRDKKLIMAWPPVGEIPVESGNTHLKSLAGIMETFPFQQIMSVTSLSFGNIISIYYEKLGINS